MIREPSRTASMLVTGCITSTLESLLAAKTSGAECLPVTKVVGPVNVVLQRSRRARPFCVHIDKIKLYESEQVPRSWLSEETDRLRN